MVGDSAVALASPERGDRKVGGQDGGGFGIGSCEHDSLPVVTHLTRQTILAFDLMR